MTALQTFTHDSLRADEVIAALLADGLTAGPPHQIHDVLLDTADGRLHRAGMRLIARLGSVTLHAAGSVPATLPLEATPRFIEDLPRGPLRSRLAGVIEMRALLPMVTLNGRGHRLQRRDRAGKVTVTVDVIEAPLLIEIAGSTGHEAAATRVADRLVTIGATQVGDAAIEVAAQRAGIGLAGFDLTPTVALPPLMRADDAFRAVFLRLSEAIELNWQGTLDQVDTEFLHDLRVAVRRTRSVLGQAKDVLPDEERKTFARRFQWLASATGPARDLDVLLLEWPALAAESGVRTVELLGPVLTTLERHRADAHHALTSAMQSARAHRLLADWRTFLTADPNEHHGHEGDEPARAGQPIIEVAAKRIKAAHRQLLSQGRLITAASPDEDLHELRKDAKKLRYAIECLGGVLPSAPRKVFVKRLKSLQDNLGRHQDAAVHADELVRVAGDLGTGSVDVETFLALGQMRERLERDRDAARAEFAGQFDAYDSKVTETDLRELLGTDGR